MSHPQDTCYHILSPISLVDGTTLRELAELHPNENVFGEQGAFSQDGLAIVMDCKSENGWESYYTVEPRLGEFVFDASNVPSYLSVGCHNVSHEVARDIVSTEGPVGTAWAKPLDN